jgi:hypothetical protein
MGVFVKTNMADAAILNFENMLQFADHLSDCRQILDADRFQEVLSVKNKKMGVFVKTNMANAAILNFE